ncbi:MAG: hypothetical protein ACKVUS_11495 [Saprospiraceae bacterium]
MTTKLFFAVPLSLISSAALSAQTPTPLHFVDRDGSGIAGLVDILGQNALTVLLGMVVLMGVVWFFCICNACAGLNKKQKNAPVSSLFLYLCVATGLSVCGSSCTTAQKAQAADIQAARAAEGGHCVYHAPLDNRHYYRNSGLNNRFSLDNYSNDNGRPFCRECGQRIHYRNR